MIKGVRMIAGKLKKSLKYVLDVAFIAVILGLTFRLLFKGQEIGEIISDLADAEPSWLMLGAAAVFCFVAGESAIIFYILRLFKKKIPFLRCLGYSFVGFFFSFITPSASGGQPAQMYYMRKDGIKVGLSSLIMLLITIAYKSMLVIYGLVLLIFRGSTVLKYAGRFDWLIGLGFALNIAFVAALFYLLMRPEKVRTAGIKLVDILTGKGIIREKNSGRYSQKIMRICDTYTLGAEYVRRNPRTMVYIFLMTAVQRLLLFSVTWIVYRSYGLTGISYVDILTLQVMIGIAVEMLPLPGAAGITEGCFMLCFEAVFGAELVKPALLLSRGLSFYLLLIVGGLITLIIHISVLRREKKREGRKKQNEKKASA